MAKHEAHEAQNPFLILHEPELRSPEQWLGQRLVDVDAELSVPRHQQDGGLSIVLGLSALVVWKALAYIFLAALTDQEPLEHGRHGFGRDAGFLPHGRLFFLAIRPRLRVACSDAKCQGDQSQGHKLYNEPAGALHSRPPMLRDGNLLFFILGPLRLPIPPLRQDPPSPHHKQILIGCKL